MIAHGCGNWSREGVLFCSSSSPGDVEPDPLTRGPVCNPWPGYRLLFL